MAEGAPVRRLAIVGSRGVPARYGAFEVAAEKIGKGLVERGWQVTVFCPHYQEYRNRSYEGMRLRHVWHPPGGVGSLVYDAISLTIASLGGYDAILVFGYGSSPFLMIPRIRRIPVVVNTDGLEWKRSKWPMAVKLYFRFAEWVVARLGDRLISDAQGIQRYYKKRYGVDSEYIAYGTELPDLPHRPEHELAEYGVEAKAYYLVVMRLEPENSILDIVRGYLASRTARPLLLVGPSTPYFERAVRPLLDGQRRARYLGPIYDRARVFALRQNAFAYIHGHTVGGTNPSLLEAMASGNFVIAKDVEFNREIVGDLGRYFGSAEDLTHILDGLETVDPAVVERAGKACKAVIQRSFEWHQIVDAYARVLESAITEARVARAN